MKKIMLFGIIFLMMVSGAFALTGNLTTILDDTYVASEDASDHATGVNLYFVNHPTYEHSVFIKWDSSSFYGVNVDVATLWVYVAGYEGDADVGAYDVQTQSWSEHMLWADSPCGSDMNVIGGSCNSTASEIKTITGTGWVSFDVTSALNRATKSSWDNFSIAIVGVLQESLNFQNIISSKEEAGNHAYIEFSYTAPSESTPPTINSTSISNELPQYNDNVELSAVCSDNVDVANIQYSNNISGSWAVISSSGAVSNPYNYSVVVANTALYNEVVGNKFTCYDSASNSVESAVLTFTSQDNVNPVVTWQNPTPADSSFIDYVNVVFNVSIVEPNIDDIVLDFNGTNETNTFTQDTGNYWHLNKLITALGTYTYTLYVNDIAGNSFTTTQRSFTVDNVVPTITWTYPASDNTTLTLRTGNLNIQGQNILLDIGNLTVYDNVGVVYNNFVTGINQPTYTFTDSIATIFNSQPDGIYTIEVCFEDYVSIRICEQKQITITTPPPPPPESFGIQEVLTESGTGLGIFLEAIRSPLVKFLAVIMILGAIIVLVVALFKGVGNVFERLR